MTTGRQLVVSLQGALENGEIFEKTPDDHPLLLVLGQSRIFPKLEDALQAMQPGETRTITLPPEYAYGPHHEDLVQTIESTVFNSSIQPTPGMILSLNVDREGRNEKVPATVTNVADGKVTLDYNHPLAGKTVIYTLKLHYYMK